MTSTSDPPMRRWIRALAVLATIVGLVTMTSCGDERAAGGQVDAADQSDAGDTPVSDTAADDPSPTEPDPAGAQPVSPEPGIGQDVRSRPFERAEVAADGASIDVYFYGGVPECYVVDRVDVERTDPSRIELTLFEGTRPEADVCIEIAVSYVTTISLDPPAAPTPAVVDGSDGQIKS